MASKTKVNVQLKNNNQSSQYQSKKKIVEKVVVKEERRAASLTASKYAAYMVCPYDAEEVVHAPSPVPVRETTIRQNIVVDLADYNEGGQFSLEVKPHLIDTLSVTSDTKDPQDQGAWAFEMNYIVGNIAIDAETGQGTHLSTGNQGSLMRITAGNITHPAISVDQDGSTIDWDYTFVVDSPMQAECTVFVMGATGGAWTNLGFASGFTGQEATGTFTSAAGTIALCFVLQVLTPYPYPLPAKLTLNMRRSAGSGNLGLNAIVSSYDTFGLPLSSAIQSLQSWRVTAQDVLVTFAGDTLNDGGSIAAARVPMAWNGVTSSGNPYSSIIALPYDRYDGALKHGCHVHWIPGAIDDLQPVDSVIEDAAFGYFKMVVAGTITHPGASVRVRVCTTVAYYSTDPSYGTMTWAPPPTDLGLLLQYVARVVPAATANDTHLLKKLSAFAGKHAKAGIKYLLDNPEALAKLAAGLVAIL